MTTRRTAGGSTAPDEDAALVGQCRARALALLETNLSPHGILAATPGTRASARGYNAVFARDAAVCALGMALSGSAALEREAATGLLTLAAHQAANGQIPKFVEMGSREADFWYLGCIDATLWWLLAVDFLDRRATHQGLRSRLRDNVQRAISWLLCQEHQRFRLLQQNEASDWADIMPRSGFVLYSNALWHQVKRVYALAGAEATRENFNQLFYPFSREIAEYRRARLLMHYVRNRAANRELYLSFVNFSFWGEEGDVLGNLLAVLFGLADGAMTRRILRALEGAGVHQPYPVRVVCNPILESDRLWRPYMGRHRQNLAWQYHNGGIWPFVGGFWAAALAEEGASERARSELAKVARANQLGNWAFNEWLHGGSHAPAGMPGQSWNAAAFLLACACLQERVFARWAERPAA
jgi:glycogen debranching enzyme